MNEYMSYYDDVDDKACSEIACTIIAIVMSEQGQ